MVDIFDLPGFADLVDWIQSVLEGGADDALVDVDVDVFNLFPSTETNIEVFDVDAPWVDIDQAPLDAIGVHAEFGAVGYCNPFCAEVSPPAFSPTDELYASVGALTGIANFPV